MEREKSQNIVSATFVEFQVLVHFLTVGEEQGTARKRLQK